MRIGLTSGKFIPLDESDESIYAYIRDDPTIGQKLLVVLNMDRGDGRGKAVNYSIPSSVDGSKSKLIITNGPAEEGSSFDKEIQLEPFEGRIYLL